LGDVLAEPDGPGQQHQGGHHRKRRGVRGVWATVVGMRGRNNAHRHRGTHDKLACKFHLVLRKSSGCDQHAAKKK
jgi:hypothetical protein